MNLQELGFTKEELQQRVVNQAVAELLSTTTCDEEGEVIETTSSLYRKLNDAIKKQIDAKISELAEKHVLPKVSEMIENLCLQQTNTWGEKIGKPVTFIEYLVKRADHYLNEEVNYKGQTKEQDSYSWTKKGTRVSYLVHEHLQYSIESAMKDALKTANEKIVGGIAEAVKIKLAEVGSALKVTVATK